jgi:exopolysaccharide biosynthesis predicted pyruvyltransferase EpsI
VTPVQDNVDVCLPAIRKNWEQYWPELVFTLRKLKSSGVRLLFIANPGNAGDALIASASWQLFDMLGLRVSSGRVEDIRCGDFIIAGGGGNLVPLYPATRNVLERSLACEVRGLVLLPHTIRGHDDVLQKLDGRFTLFCRDQIGLDHVKVSAPIVELHLSPDMALGLDLRALRMRAASRLVRLRARISLLPRKRRRRYAGWLESASRVVPDENGHLLVLRNDIESLRLFGSRNGDLSGMYGSSFRSRDECDLVSARFLQVIDQAKTVTTDRLHVAIASNLLGKPVKLLNNSYGKNHAVVSTFPTLTALIQCVENDVTQPAS